MRGINNRLSGYVDGICDFGVLGVRSLETMHVLGMLLLL